MKINKYNRSKDGSRGGGSGNTYYTTVVGGGGAAQGGDAEHADTADYADVAGNLDENSSDWDTIDAKDEAVKTWAGLQFLSKLVADTAQGLITFVSGIVSKVVSVFEQGATFGNYVTGALGTGGAVLIDQQGNSIAEFDYLTVRKAATFRELTIKELRHVGGEIILSAAAMKCSRVVPIMDTSGGEPVITYYQCFFDTDDETGTQKVFQEFVVGDLARCQTFGTASGVNGYVTTKYYWRKVVAVGEDYIMLSNLSGEVDTMSNAPEAGDNIVQLGYVGNDKPYRQSAIILSATDSDAPSMKFYQGIHSFSLPSPVKDEGYNPVTGIFHSNVYGDFFVGDANSYVEYDSANDELNIKGTVNMSSSSQLNGQNLQTTLGNMSSATADVAAAVNNLSTGVENLVVNGGFTGLYSSESVEDLTDVDANTQIFSEPFGRWSTHTGCTIVTAVASATGVACKLQNGTLVQTIARGIKSGEKYTFSLRGIAAGTVTVSIGGVSQSITVVAGARTNVKLTASSTNAALTITGSATITEILLVQGNITINDWVPSPEDNNKYLAYYKNLAYLMEAIGNASTTTLGGLILTQMIRVGNYANGVMTQETGGMSGSNAAADSPFLWGGGTMTQALATIAAYANDPAYQPTQQELANMAKFVVTHSGQAILNDIILRGIVYATGGKFTGKDGLYRIELDGVNRRLSVFGPSLVESASDLTPKAGATEVEFLRIGDFTPTVGTSSGWRVEPNIKMAEASGTADVTLNTYSGLVFKQLVSGATKSTIFGPNALYADGNYFTLVLKGLPTDPSSLEVGQVYRDGSGYLKIKTS